METERTLALGAAVLVGFTAIVHVVLGLGGLLDWVIDGDRSFLALLFVIAGIGLLGGIGAVAAGTLAPRPAYVLGAIIMAGFLVGYADWHAFGLTEEVLGLEGHEQDDHGHGHDDNGHSHDDHHDDGHSHDHDHDHDGGAIEVLGDHLVGDPIALATKSAEAIALGLLLVLSVASRNDA